MMSSLRGAMLVVMLVQFFWVFFPGTAFGQWYSGGTLHATNGLEWQKADASNRGYKDQGGFDFTWAGHCGAVCGLAGMAGQRISFLPKPCDAWHKPSPATEAKAHYTALLLMPLV